MDAKGLYKLIEDKYPESVVSSVSELQKRPLITVVTVSYNAAATIEKTMLSVLGQTYPNIEYIVIDGGSTDGTVDVIKKYQDRIAYWVSEPDKGIYDAMNKGIAKATGEWINFMNCGDLFYDECVVKTLFATSFKFNDADVLYGDTRYVNNGECFYRKPDKLDAFVIIPFCHQSAFVRGEIMKENPFDTSFRYVADQKLFFSLWKRGFVFCHFPYLVAVFDTTMGSISSDNPFECMNERWRILKDESIGLKFLLGKQYIMLVYRYVHHKLHLIKCWCLDLLKK